MVNLDPPGQRMAKRPLGYENVLADIFEMPGARMTGLSDIPITTADGEAAPPTAVIGSMRMLPA